MDSKKVFISYSHDSPGHAARVAGLAASFRRDGVECRIDAYEAGSPPEGWPLWMERSIKWAEFVLVVCTETYLRRVKKEEPLGKGLGATWEAHLIYLHLYEGRLFNAKFIPVLFDPADEKFIPTPLRTASRYLLDGQKGYDRLYATITGQRQPPPIGSVKVIAPDGANPLFGEPGGEAAAAKGALKQPRLKDPEKISYPDDPYPLLRPYTHPDLFAGRERDLVELERLLTDQIPVLSLYSTSGAGKSSLLHAGLAPRLRRKGWPVAYTAYPKDRDLAKRLVEGMLAWENEIAFGDEDPAVFREAVRTAHDLSGHPAVLVLDQFEDVIDPAADKARERIARLMTATIEERPFCRWILSYRHEFHGRVEEWLRDAFRQADVTWRGRLATYPLKPLGDADSTEESRQAFLSAITAPLRVKDEQGQLRYSLSFEEGGAERLADAFARARMEQPTAPLLPELQVALAHLIKESDGSPIQVPENPEARISRAIADHLRRAVHDAAPSDSAEGRQRRAEIFLALRDLADEDGRRNEGRPADQLKAQLGQEVWEKLSEKHRLLYQDRSGNCVLSHDRLAEAVVEQANDPGIREWLDEETVALRPVVAAKTALLGGDREEATNLGKGTFKRIQRHSKALITTDPRRKWWAECVQRRRRDQRKKWTAVGQGMAVLAVVVTVGTFLGYRQYRSDRIDDLKKQLRGGDPGPALEAVSELAEWNAAEDAIEVARERVLSQNSFLIDLFELGPAGVADANRSRVVLNAAEALTPLFLERLKSDFESTLAEIGVLVWALDYSPARTGVTAAKAGRVRQSLVDAMRREKPTLPRLGTDDWAFLEGGTFRMCFLGFQCLELTFHKVKVSSFRLLKHEVTNAEFSALFGGFRATEKPTLPAVAMDWRQAYAFAAWVGGRLPTEAEWVYAALSGGKDRLYPWGDETAGICERALVSECGRGGPLPVCSRPKGNTEQGACDMAGNAREWVADWAFEDPKQDEVEPWGPLLAGGARGIRGGSFDQPADFASAFYRDGNVPTHEERDLGFRVVLPAVPQP